MNAPACKQLSLAELIEYWFDELNAERVVTVEEHLFVCASCNVRLEHVVSLGEATRELVQQGRIAATLTPAAVDKIRSSGLRLREYHVAQGGSVNCTITPDDDLVVSHLHAPLGSVGRLDLVVDDLDAGWQVRVPDIGFDSAAAEVAVIPRAADVRKMQRTTQRMRLFAMDDAGEHLIGEYLFHHSPHQEIK